MFIYVALNAGDSSKSKIEIANHNKILKIVTFE